MGNRSATYMDETGCEPPLRGPTTGTTTRSRSSPGPTRRSPASTSAGHRIQRRRDRDLGRVLVRRNGLQPAGILPAQRLRADLPTPGGWRELASPALDDQRGLGARPVFSLSRVQRRRLRQHQPPVADLPGRTSSRTRGTAATTTTRASPTSVFGAETRSRALVLAEDQDIWWRAERVATSATSSRRSGRSTTATADDHHLHRRHACQQMKKSITGGSISSGPPARTTSATASSWGWTASSSVHRPGTSFRIQEPPNGYNAEDPGMKIVAPLINSALEG